MMDITVDFSNIVLNTPRIMLRGWQLSDLADFYNYAKIEGVGEMAGWQHHSSIDITKNILDDFIKHKNVFAIVLKETNQVIGSLSVVTSYW